MAHGYLGDGYGVHGEIDPDRGDREWRERNFQGRGGDWSDRDRRMMFSDRAYGSPSDDRWIDRGYSHGSRGFSANPDDHYRSWRDRHMSEIDREYEEYCSERERQFHRDFDDWRRNKYGNPQPLRTGMTQSGLSHDPTGETQAAEDTAPAAPTSSSPTAAATLGTNSGRSRSRG
jgi:hypothetical protein